MAELRNPAELARSDRRRGPTVEAWEPLGDRFEHALLRGRIRERSSKRSRAAKAGDDGGKSGGNGSDEVSSMAAAGSAGGMRRSSCTLHGQNL